MVAEYTRPMKTDPAPSPGPAPLRRLTILIVDDEPAMRDLLQISLQHEGHRILVAASGEEGRALALQAQPDIIVCDVNMPGLTGHEVLHSLHDDAETRHIPFIFLSGCREAQSIRLGMAAGAAEYLIKPFRPEELTEAIAACAKKLAWLDQAPGSARLANGTA